MLKLHHIPFGQARVIVPRQLRVDPIELSGQCNEFPPVSNILADMIGEDVLEHLDQVILGQLFHT